MVAVQKNEPQACCRQAVVTGEEANQHTDSKQPCTRQTSLRESHSM